jgi:replication factor A1
MKGNWRIKLRCTKKSDIRTWENDKGSGSLVNCDFCDRDGNKIQATLFKEMIDTYGSKILPGGVYIIQ